MKQEKRRDLVPLEKARRVIHLYNRNSNREVTYPRLGLLFYVLGFLCIIYCLGISMVGFGTYFFLIWDGIGIFSLLMGFILRSERILGWLPGWVKKVFVGLLSVGMILFCVVEGLILLEFGAKASPGADYCIVLGAQWKSTGPSEVLRRRLDKAVEYLEENPDTMVIVSGGQGSNEQITEAAGMRQYLVAAGVDDYRIIMEEASTSTYENLIFSAAFLQKESDKVVLVTNNFHTYRATQIAEKQGYENVEALAASSVPGLLPNNLLREFIGVMKDFIMGNM